MTGVFGKRPALRAALLALVGGLLSAPLALAEADGLARLVPDTAGLCIEADDLAGALSRLRNGTLAKRASQNAAMSAGLTRSLQHLTRARGTLQAQLGITDQQSSVLLGGQALIAVWPDKSTGPGGTGLLILRCPDEQLLQRVADNIVARQRQAGRLGTPRRLAVGGQSVEVQTIRTERSGSQVCLAIVGRLAVVSTSGPLLDEVVAAELDGPSAAPLADLPAYRAAIERLNCSAPLRVFLNPRRWDDPMHALKRPAAGRKALVHDAIAGLWQASDYLSASLEAADALKLEVFLGCQHDRLNEPLRSVFSSLEGPSQLAARLPPGCLAAAAGRLDLGRMLRGLLDSRSLGQYDLQPPTSFNSAAALALAGSLGPECSLAILPPTEPDAGGQPNVPWLIGLETHGVDRDRAGPPTASWLVPWLRETMRVAASAAKTRGEEPALQCTIVKRDGVELTGISGLPRLPGGETLFLAEQQRLLWLGNSAQLTSQAAQEARSPSGNRRYAALRHPRLNAPSDVLLVDLAEIRRAAEKMSATSGRGFLTAGKWVALLPLAGLADGLLVQVQCDPACTAITLHIACD